MKNSNKSRFGITNGMYKHGKSNTRLHKIWDGIKYRCYNPNAPRYEDWGGRGITMCDEWRDSFIAFYEWSIANGYNDTLSIDRINNDLGYCPENCRWATHKEQVKNRRCCINIEHNGIVKSLEEWSEESGIKYATLYHRYRLGWNSEDILMTPVNYRCYS